VASNMASHLSGYRRPCGLAAGQGRPRVAKLAVLMDAANQSAEEHRSYTMPWDRIMPHR
jgi:hypothetical protein